MSQPRDPKADLAALIESARAVKMTAADREAQRRSFAYGNVAIENPRVTRALVAELADHKRTK